MRVILQKWHDESFARHPGQKSRFVDGRFAAYFLCESNAIDGKQGGTSIGNL